MSAIQRGDQRFTKNDEPHGIYRSLISPQAGPVGGAGFGRRRDLPRRWPEVHRRHQLFRPHHDGPAVSVAAGVITYYTDQGDLSPILPNAAANSFVASAFSQWSSVATAALAITSGGQLAEDVNGTNVILNSDGTISMPADIQPTATGTPIGIVYDYDGTVTDALIGAGAGNSSQCFSNAAFGGNDNYGTFASYQHALIVINGQCAQQSSQLTDVEYRLVRVIGSVLGLGWSQVNPNVLTRTPAPTSDDFAGFPVMHSTDPLNCVPITVCYPNPYQFAMDDDRRHLPALSCHGTESVELPRQAGVFRRHGAYLRLGVVHRPSRKSHAGHAGSECGGALDRSDDWLAVAQVCRRVGVRFSIHRQRRQSHHRLRRRRWDIPLPNGGRATKPWKAFSTSPACSCRTAAARNIS